MFKPFKTFRLTWWQGSIFKLTMLLFGVFVGATWHEFFAAWRAVELFLFFWGAVYLTFVWWKQ